jgi:hypothetical protein
VAGHRGFHMLSPCRSSKIPYLCPAVGIASQPQGCQGGLPLTPNPCPLSLPGSPGATRKKRAEGRKCQVDLGLGSDYKIPLNLIKFFVV